MVSIEFRFLAGRYHATPWGRHVNEAEVEWPPSPYRILRALYDVWQRRHPELPAAEVQSVFTQLGSAHPDFALPPAVAAHTRSYLSSNTTSQSDKSLIFDGFLSLNAAAPCVATWPVELTPSQSRVLSLLLRDLNFLGRSESWVDATLVDSPSAKSNCKPALQRSTGEIIPVASYTSPQEFGDSQKWFKALTYSTSDMLKEKRSAPPALRLVSYERDSNAIASWVRPKPKQTEKSVSLVELTLHSKVLPLATDALKIAELVRAALMKKYGEKSRNFSGKDADSIPLKDHSHTYYLPQFDDLGRINKVMLLLGKGNYLPDELEAIRSLRRLWQFGGEDSMRVVVTRADAASNRAGDIEVTSTTPFIPARHFHPNREDWDSFAKAELIRECANHGLPEPIAIEDGEKPFFEMIHFRRSRKGEAPRRGKFFRLRFAEPVPVPFSLGYCCHFGLGQFNQPR